MEVKINNGDQVDAAELIKDFSVKIEDNFVPYLKEIYKDLVLRNEDKSKNLTKITFLKYFDIPGILSERLFAVFDESKTGSISQSEFIAGMTNLYSGDIEKQINFVFDFYDFDKDGKISREDVRIVLSYIPLSIVEQKLSKAKGMQFKGADIKDRIESQDELHKILQNCFKNDNDLIDKAKFTKLIQEVHSELFLFLIIFLLEKKPFSKTTLKEFKSPRISVSTVSAPIVDKVFTERKQEKSNTDKTPSISASLLGANLNAAATAKTSNTPSTSPRFLIKSPKQVSKFAPAEKIQKSPCLKNTKSQDDTDATGTVKGKYTLSINTPDKSKTTALPSKEAKVNSHPFKDLKNSPHTEKDPNNASYPIRRNRNILLELEDNIKRSSLPPKSEQTDYSDDIIFTKAVKQKDSGDSGNGVTGHLKKDMETVKDEFGVVEKVDADEEDIVKHSGYLLKISKLGKLKKVFFKLIGKDIYFYKSADDPEHKGMHNLTGIFVQKEPQQKVEGISFHSFSVIYPNKKRFYLSENESEINLWINNIQKAIGYTNLTDIYTIKDKLGNGKFGLVKLGIHKETLEKVAIKILTKKDMSAKELELAKTEIEILKVCQHPNIIRIFDIFENVDYIYIIMEYCAGGDFFVYLQKRKFKLAETHAAQIIHKIAAAVYYLHSYGIAHRDLKPENILMTDITDNADIRIMDFGLSKIIGPNETCIEPYGTLSYVSPEVLLEKPYNKSVDLWTIGIITYMILAAALPFDDPNSEREIARQTIYEPVKYNPKVWSKLSAESKDFVDRLLVKDPKKRMTIKEVLEHSWIQKFTKTKLTEKRRGSKDLTSNFELYTTTDDTSSK